jgi:ribonuclease HII
MKLRLPKVARPDLSSESTLGFFASKIIIGVDEVGRGCLAGSVVAAAAVLCPIKIKAEGFKDDGLRPGGRRKSKLHDLRDSKLVPEAERAELAAYLETFVIAYAIGEASVQEIESLNIYYASHLAMERAVEAVEIKLGRRADSILVDGNRVPKKLLDRGIPIVKGDNRSISIASAALLAKVHRDQQMHALDLQYPGYGFLQHKGYGTPFHRARIQELGATPIHRKDFKGVRAEIKDTQEDLFEDFDELSVPL